MASCGMKARVEKWKLFIALTLFLVCCVFIWYLCNPLCFWYAYVRSQTLSQTSLHYSPKLSDVSDNKWYSEIKFERLTCLLYSCSKSSKHSEISLLSHSLNSLDLSLTNTPFMAGYSWDSKGALVSIGYRYKGVHQNAVLHYKANKPLLLSVTQIKHTEVVHIVVGVRHRRQRLLEFLNHVIKHLFTKDPYFVLHVVYSQDRNDCLNVGPETDCMTSEDARQLVGNKLAVELKLKWRFEVDSQCGYNNEGFSRGCTLNKALESLKNEDLVLLCDVDVTINADALQRCRANTVLNTKAYFPVLFSLYNQNGPYSELHNTNLQDSCINVRKDSPNKTEKCNFNNPSDQGFWRMFGFGMACIYKGDSVRVDGFYESSGWGGEDVNFYGKIAQMGNMEVLRGPEPGLIHAYHHKECKSSNEDHPVRPSLYPDCLKSKALLEGSQSVMAALLLQNINENV